jgi:hypothetical protein
MIFINCRVIREILPPVDKIAIQPLEKIVKNSPNPIDLIYQKENNYIVGILYSLYAMIIVIFFRCKYLYKNHSKAVFEMFSLFIIGLVLFFITIMISSCFFIFYSFKLFNPLFFIIFGFIVFFFFVFILSKVLDKKIGSLLSLYQNNLQGLTTNVNNIKKKLINILEKLLLSFGFSFLPLITFLFLSHNINKHIGIVSCILSLLLLVRLVF